MKFQATSLFTRCFQIKHPLPLAVLGVSLIGITPSRAITPTWSDGTTGTWFTGTNWSGGTAPGSTTLTSNTDTAHFANTTASVITIDPNRNLKTIDFDVAGTASTTITPASGGSLLLTTAGTISDASAANQIVNAPIVIENSGATGFGTGTFTTAAGAGNNGLTIGGNVSGVATATNQTVLTLTASNTATSAVTGNVISGIISDGTAGGNLALKKTGGGQWNLTGANTFTGGIMTTGGVLSAQDSTANGTSGQNVNVAKDGFGSGTLNLGGGGIQILANGFGDGSSQIITYGNNVNVTSNSSISVDEVTPGGASQNKTIALGTVFIGATKSLTVNGADGYVLGLGATSLGGNAILTPTAGGAVTLSSLTIDNSATTLSTFTATLGGVGGTGTGKISGVVSNNATDSTKVLALTVSGGGTWTLSGANTYSGATQISSSILNIQNNTALGSTASGTTIGAGATLQLQNNITVGAEALTLAGAGASGTTGALENVSGTNTYGGALTETGASTIASDAGTLNLTGGISGTSNLTLGGAGNGSESGVIATGAGTVTKTGAGSWVFSNANTYSGTTAVSSGTLYVNNTSGSGSGTGSGAVTVASGGVLAGSGFITSSGITVSGGGKLSSGAVQTGGPTVTGTGLTLTNTPLTVGSSIGTANLTFDLGAGNTGLGGTPGNYAFATPNNNTTYLSLAGSSSINFAGPTSISLVDLTNGSLALTTGTPYLLIHANSDTSFLDLVIATGTGPNTTYSLSNVAGVDGWVVGVYNGTGATDSTYLSTHFTPISISQYGADGLTALNPVYPDPALYLNAGNLEVVPEPGTWALMLGGLGVLVLIQRRKGKLS